MAPRIPRGPGPKHPARPAEPAERKQAKGGLESRFERVRGEVSKDREDRGGREYLAEDRIGDRAVTAEELVRMAPLSAARHLMILLARGRHDGRDRADVLSEVGELLIALDRPELVRGLLFDMPSAGRIIDVYPLEVMRYVIARRADLVPGVELGEIVLNKKELEASTHDAEATIALRVPLALKMRAFAVEGGAAPGYVFAPGPPGEYHFEVGEPGRFSLLLRGDVRRKSLIDRIVLDIAD